MPDTQEHDVVLLYVHALLGEGIAAYVTNETGVRVSAVSALDPDAVASALASHPRVVIFERSPAVDADRITCQAPGAVVFDMSAAATTGPRIPEQGEAPAVEAIVDAVAGLGVGHPHAS